MKKILLLTTLFLISIANAQQYNAELNLFVKANGGGNYGDGCRNDIRVVLKFTDNSEITLLSEDLNGVGRSNYVNFTNNIQYPKSKSVSQVIVYTSRNWKRTFGGCGGNGSFNNSPKTHNVSFCKNYFDEFSDGSDDDDIARWWDVKFDLDFYPIIDLTQSSNTIIGFEDNFTVSVNSNSIGFNSSDYIWQYQIVSNGGVNPNNWLDMPNSVIGQSSFTIIPSSFLNIDDIGKKLYLKIANCDSDYESIPVFYNLKPSAPHINIQDEEDSKCYMDDNGSAKVYLDRAVEDDEIFALEVILNGGLPTNYNNLTKDDFDANNSFLLQDLVPGNYSIRIFNPNYYTGSPTHTDTFTINEPTPVEFSIIQIDNVWCNGGSDGSITIQAKGGQLLGTYEYLLQEVGDTTGNWVAFSNTGPLSGTFPNFYREEIITGLPPAMYELKVRDSNGCIAKEIVRDGGGTIVGLGNEVIETIEITEPGAPVAIDLNVFSVEPTAFGFSDGRITAQITGGTPLSDGTYNYTWTHSNGTTWTTFSDIVNSDGWFLTLENAISGTYTLTVTDANYSNATDTAGCTIIDAEFTLNEPPLLELSITETNAISCNNTNTFSDPSSDGELTAIATGGVQLQPADNNGLLYYYTWKKKDASGIYQILTGETSNVLSNIDTGDYAVNIVDANGITVGTASNNVVTPVDELYTLTQPDLLQIALTKVDVFCNAGNDGSINATITGGTGNYTISWNNGATTEDINTLVAGTYTIDVTDEKGCQAQSSITIDEPANPLEINYIFFSPTFTGATNGWIEATVTGGTSLASGAYTYNWTDSNGTNLNTQVTETINASSYVIKLNDIGDGIYYLTIEDKNHPLAINPTNCTIIDSEHELFEPEPLMAEIELHTPISCNSTNTYGDPFSDGALEVIAEGGVQLQATDNNGLPYYYTWKKETSPGVWTVLTTQVTNIATGLDAGNYAVNIEDANGIIIGVYVNNALVNATDVTYLFEEPTLLELALEKQDVYCFNGSDSWARAIITGGTPPYDILWSNGDTTEQTSNLSQGIYDVAITDSRGCQVDGSIQINQPTEPLELEYTAFATPSTGGASDGWIEAQITGGTDFPDGSYTYYWLDEAANILNAQTTTNIVGGVFQIRLNNIPKGNYYLTIEDANYPLASTNDGCTIIDDEFILYDPIEATISVETPISCHQDNEYNDPFSDGALEVVVTGGLPFASGQPYIYYWKKENIGGAFDDLNQNSDIASGLSDGNYALNVEDSRGIVIGVYESLNLIQAIDELFYFEEPELLEVSLTKTEISCGAGNDGTATVSINGGIAPYSIQWSNGQSTATATNLIAGNYVAYITDARGCQVTENINIAQPGGLMIDIVQQINPTCFQGNDGQIELSLSGGVAPYTYSWNTGETTTTLDNLTEDTYVFTLVDANGCTAFKEIILEHPDEIIIDLGEDRTLCQSQSHNLDGSISDPNATYSWTADNGFSSTNAQVTVTEAGTYQVAATSALGCTATDSVVIAYNDTAIDVEFLLSSQAYVDDDVILFNVSNPLGDTSTWDIPSNVTIVSETATAITLHFPEPNTYEIGLISTQGDCYAEQYKNIVVETGSGLPSSGDTENPFIEEFTLTPNPNSGQFELYINLAESSPIALRIFDINGEFILQQPTPQTLEEYTISMNVSMASGVYFIVLETAQETQVKRMIVM